MVYPALNASFTVQRDFHPFSYYDRLFELLEVEKGRDLVLCLAYADEELLAGIIVLFNGKEVISLYGASSNEKSNLNVSLCSAVLSLRYSMIQYL